MLLGTLLFSLVCLAKLLSVCALRVGPYALCLSKLTEFGANLTLIGFLNQAHVWGRGSLYLSCERGDQLQFRSPNFPMINEAFDDLHKFCKRLLDKDIV